MAKKQSNGPQVAILMGSESDLPIMKGAAELLNDFQVPNEMLILSAHRTPEETALFAKSARARGLRVIIAGAGGAAHLPGVLASMTELPVIGVPIGQGALQGLDALYAIVQMPKGVPVATVAINGATNAGILAVQMIAAGGLKQDPDLLKKLTRYKEGLRKKGVQNSRKLTKSVD